MSRRYAHRELCLVLPLGHVGPLFTVLAHRGDIGLVKVIKEYTGVGLYYKLNLPGIVSDLQSVDCVLTPGVIDVVAWARC